jgi:hypothetical protein
MSPARSVLRPRLKDQDQDDDDEDDDERANADVHVTSFRRP